MKFTYKVGKENFNVTFCPDSMGLKLTKTKYPYMQISKNLNKIQHDNKILLVVDKNINKKIVKYIIHDLKISFPKLKVLFVEGNKINKNLRTFFKIIDCLFKNKFTKNSVMISCGGGVIGDVSGLSASLYLRGLNYFHIPTTMTAIIDSCIGGKNGINYNNIINSLGTYYHPQNVYISKTIIKYLPKREYIAGIPEIIKCGLINKSNLLDYIKVKDKIIKRDFTFLSKIIKKTLITKIKFFKDDVREKNQRLMLNFGHTFSHAIESALDNNFKGKKKTLRHGEAVGIGMLCEIFYAYGKNELFYKIKSLLKLYSLPTNLKKININESFVKKEIFKFIFLDKKKIGKHPRYINVKKIGSSKIADLDDSSRIIKTIEDVLFC